LAKLLFFSFVGADKKDKKSDSLQFRKDFTDIIKADSLLGI
jgi:hypothetical protein